MRRLRHRITRSRVGAALWRIAPLCLAAGLAGCTATSPIEDFVTAGSGARTASVATAGNPLLPLLRSVRHQPDITVAADPYSPLHSTRAPYRLAATHWPWTPEEEDAIIAQAVTAHEMRRP
jgi:hypothetical protein